MHVAAGDVEQLQVVQGSLRLAGYHFALQGSREFLQEIGLDGHRETCFISRLQD